MRQCWWSKARSTRGESSRASAVTYSLLRSLFAVSILRMNKHSALCICRWEVAPPLVCYKYQQCSLEDRTDVSATSNQISPKVLPPHPNLLARSSKRDKPPSETRKCRPIFINKICVQIEVIANILQRINIKFKAKKRAFLLLYLLTVVNNVCNNFQLEQSHQMSIMSSKGNPKKSILINLKYSIQVPNAKFLTPLCA